MQGGKEKVSLTCLKQGATGPSPEADKFICRPFCSLTFHIIVMAICST